MVLKIKCRICGRRWTPNVRAWREDTAIDFVKDGSRYVYCPICKTPNELDKKSVYALLREAKKKEGKAIKFLDALYRLAGKS